MSPWAVSHEEASQLFASLLRQKTRPMRVLVPIRGVIERVWHVRKTLTSIDDSAGGQGRRRSVDLRFFRPALYQLSYLTSIPKAISSASVGGDDGI